jgi:hypothetical protein
MARKVRCLLALTVLSLVPYAGQARAADPPEAEPIRTIQLQLHPAPEPRFALQYLFETPYLEQEPGNAAFLYQTAVGQMMQTNSGDWAIDRDTLRQWYRDPVESLPLEKVRPVIARFEQSFRLLEAAARREYCTWEYPIRKEGFPYMNPLLNEYRTVSRLLAVKAKLEIHDGDIDAALKTMYTGFALARDLGDGPHFVQHLVGVSMAAGMLGQIEGLIQAPEAPNLYWALTTLPDPLVSIRHAVQMESECLAAEVPELRTLEETVLSNEQALDLWQRAAVWVGYDNGGPDRWLDKARDLATAMELYPQAKATLLEQGYSAEKVEAWPALYVVVLHQYRQFRAIRDLTFKWTYVPYAQTRERLRQGDLAISGLWKYGNASGLLNPFVYSLPATYRIAFLDARLKRDIAILRCVEAIRMYAADHDGKLPDSLDAITAVPIPLDPLYDQAFRYKLAGGKAILESPVPPDGGPKDGLRYEITLR